MLVKLNELNENSKKWLSAFANKQIVLLSGDLGVGKTQTVKSFLRHIDPTIKVTSPTFSIINEYISGNKKIFHIDLYRIKSSQDLESTGFWDIFSVDEGIVFIEWSERLPENEKLPTQWNIKKLNITPVDQETRNFQWL